MEKLGGQPVYLYPNSADTVAQFQSMWETVIEAPRAPSDSVEVQGRSIHVPEAYHGMARFSFEESVRSPARRFGLFAFM